MCSMLPLWLVVTELHVQVVAPWSGVLTLGQPPATKDLFVRHSVVEDRRRLAKKKVQRIGRAETR